jgi:hypothetical protein
MAGKITNCARARESMADAAAGALVSNRVDFDVHLRGCPACREEFCRTQALLQSIDRFVSASVAPEPSPQLNANVRQAIAEQPARESGRWPRSAWLTAAGVCAVLAICFLAVRTLHDTHEIAPRFAANPASASPVPDHNAAAPTPVPPVQLANSAAPHKPAPAARHVSARARHEVAEAVVVVEPGQIQAIFDLVAATRRGRIDGNELLAGRKKMAEPLEIQPLTIAPLQIATLTDESEHSASDGSAGGSKDFVSDRSN